MKPFALSRSAEQRLGQIAGWTTSKYGHDKALKYQDQLIDTLNQLTDGKLPDGKPCAELLGEKHADRQVHYLLSGQHHIVYERQPDQIVVLDFIHRSMDLERHLGAAGDQLEKEGAGPGPDQNPRQRRSSGR
ncbi:MAG: type II toxin-antitoxin system RelE/ParE family toxin [Pseudomonadota bacterium]